ncbi:hypothetical protein LL972_18715 [Xanthomonas campestris pv. asclepiadis]|uniref:type III secretion system effector XopAV n=1 Tax=Xanthomonas campestris TaxID=339 RepID=UPI001E57F1DB|nr:type III secretion system effector XopAV [Xanthomonas campestris]MCC4618001.1 hypothetical protein [Xanthomonas campestris pv. asclepiadis]
MRPVNLTSATQRGARRDQDSVPTWHAEGLSSQQGDPHVNPQLTQNLRPRPPVRHAELVRNPHTPIGVRIANIGMQAANFGVAVASVPALTCGLNALSVPAAVIDGYLYGDARRKDYAVTAAAPALAMSAVVGTLYSVGRLAAWYVQAQAQATVTKADRAKELGTTEACLDAAIEMVTMSDAETSAPEMNEGERAALAMDLMNLVMADRSRLPPELWGAASGIGDDPRTLVSRLLAAAQNRASEQASALSAG